VPISIEQQLKLSHYDEYTLKKGQVGSGNMVMAPMRTFDNRSMLYKKLHQMDNKFNQ